MEMGDLNIDCTDSVSRKWKRKWTKASSIRRSDVALLHLMTNGGQHAPYLSVASLSEKHTKSITHYLSISMDCMRH
eukprot:scaffold155916_cov31-Prasinocladus_malaysianus.AAC.2